LLALAVIDDVGGIIVIALFYSTGVGSAGLVVALAGVAAIRTLNAIGVRKPWLYAPAAILLWTGMHRAGVHPTLAGVIVGLLTPVDAWLGRGAFVRRVREHLHEVELAPEGGHAQVLDQLDAINEARREVVSPVDRLQHAFHGAVAYVVMPLFALSNAGVRLSAASLDALQRPVVLGVALGLALGKPIGITLGCLLAVKARVAVLPAGLRWSHVALVGVLGGIGFTVSLFVATLAFASGAALDAAKTAVLIASALAGLLSFAVGRVVLSPSLEPGAARTESEAERSTEK
jgi:NhaA family Na+:H+ antiporter